jgi:cytochrome c oxidase assembly factor 5
MTLSKLDCCSVPARRVASASAPIRASLLPATTSGSADQGRLMSSSCKPLIEGFRNCVLSSPCVQRDGLLPSECLKHHANELPEDCQALRKAVFECKRGMVGAFESLVLDLVLNLYLA